MLCVKQDTNFVSYLLAVSLQTAKYHIARCSLTLLAIQAPLVSKHCGICGKQYLNEAKLDILWSPNAAPDSENEPNSSIMEPQESLSLAKLLLTACKSCIYCGGKFTKR